VVTVVTAAVATRAVAVPADVGQVDTVNTADSAEGEERLAEASPSVENDAEAVTEARVDLADVFTAGQAGAVLDGGEAVVATLEVAVPADISQAADVGTPIAAKSPERVVEACAPKEQDPESLDESAASPDDKVAASLSDVVPDG
ncbi:unnamed protein product, partial [Laminaria digitata]